VAATDADLVRGALDGSERAFQELVRRFERPVLTLITRMIGDPSRAEELAQDTFVKAFQRLDSYDTERRFASWLLAIAHHTAVDELRRGRIQTEPLDDASPVHARASGAAGDMPAAAAERAELKRLLEAAIGRLRPEYAELVTLRYEQEFTLEEIADTTGLPVGTIKSYLHRARIELGALVRAGGWRA
jgi:RNA polymerase sigma-70 factor (ECF subfamily)